MRAMDVMTTDVITVDPDTTVQALATLLAERGISGAPVVDLSGRLVGIISEGDLLHRAEIGTARRHRERRRSWWLDHFASDLAREYVKSHGRTVKDIMTRDVVTVTEDTDLGEVAALLEAKRIKRVPVMREGKVVGIISRANIVRAVGATKGAPPQRGRGRRPLDPRAVSSPSSAVRNGRRSGRRTLSSATVSCISGSRRMSLTKKASAAGRSGDDPWRPRRRGTLCASAGRSCVLIACPPVSPGRQSKGDGREGGGWLLSCHCAGSLLLRDLSFTHIASDSQELLARPVGGRRELTISYSRPGSSLEPYRFEPSRANRIEVDGSSGSRR